MQKKESPRVTCPTFVKTQKPIMSRVLALLVSAFACSLAQNATQRFEFTVNLAPGAPKESFTVEVHPEWAPLGAARFQELVEANFFPGVRFFRTIKGFMTQFGINGKPEIAAQWREKKIADDPAAGLSNKKGYLSFATSGKDSRTTQIFINLVDNANLDGMGFTPFAIVTEGGMEVVDKIYSGYGEGGSGDGLDGRGPSQGRLQEEGNKYLKKVRCLPFSALLYFYLGTVYLLAS